MACNGNCNCNCKDEDFIFDESGFIVGAAGPVVNPEPSEDNRWPGLSLKELLSTFDPEINSTETDEPTGISYKYAEDKILAELKAHLDQTYAEHYKTEDQQI